MEGSERLRPPVLVAWMMHCAPMRAASDGADTKSHQSMLAKRSGRRRGSALGLRVRTESAFAKADSIRADPRLDPLMPLTLTKSLMAMTGTAHAPSRKPHPKPQQ